MTRIEIIANQSVLEEITEDIEAASPQILYTIIPLAHGKGRRDRKLGTSTWPETNFILICYAGDEVLEKVKSALNNVKKRFPTEGISSFFVKAEDTFI